MTIADGIRLSIERLSPQPVRDDCLAARLEHADSHRIMLRTCALADSGGFELPQGRSSICGNAGRVARRM